MRTVFIPFATLLTVFLLFKPAFSQAGYNNDEHSIIIDSGSAYSVNVGKHTEDSTLIEGRDCSLTIQADFYIYYVWIYNEYGYDEVRVVNNFSYEISIPSGSYHIFLGYNQSDHRHTIFIRDSLYIISDTTVVFSQEEKTFLKEFKLLRDDGSHLRINTISFIIDNIISGTELNIRNRGIDSISFQLRYNMIPSYLFIEWAVKGKQLANNNNLYLLNNELIDINENLTITNDPLNYASADFYYHLADSVEKNYDVEIFTFLPNFHYNSYGYDPKYQFPFHLKIYQDTSADFQLYASLFSQGLYAENILFGLMYTPEIRIGDSQVVGYHFQEKEAPPFIISDTKNVHLGLTPTYWFGKFYNKSDSIKIRSPYGRFDFLFLSQTNDVLRHYPIPYTIFKEEQVVREGEFNLWFGPPALRLGFDIDDLTIPISSGYYEMEITDTQNEVVKYPGISEVRAGFDLSHADKNPPNLILFQIIKGQELSNILTSEDENKIRFILEDNENIESIKLFYSTLKRPIKHELEINYKSPYWEAELPVLREGYYSVYLFASDSSGNYIETRMQPAFYYGNITSIGINREANEIETFRLYQNYPNPFNSGTTVSYSVPSSYNGTVDIALFNTLGQRVKVIKNILAQPGINKFYWNGRNEQGNSLPSGVYFINLKGGGKNLKRKLLLLK